MAQMKLSVPLHIFGVFPVDIVVFGKRVRYNEDEKKNEGVKSMKIVCFLLKLMLKILLLPVAFLLRFLCFIWNLLMQLSLWVLSPVILFVLGCGIYSVVRASWTDVFLLTLIEMGLFAAAVGAGGIMELMERLCERVEDVLLI